MFKIEISAKTPDHVSFNRNPNRRNLMFYYLVIRVKPVADSICSSRHGVRVSECCVDIPMSFNWQSVHIKLHYSILNVLKTLFAVIVIVDIRKVLLAKKMF